MAIAQTWCLLSAICVVLLFGGCAEGGGQLSAADKPQVARQPEGSTLTVQVQYPGASAEEVESQVTVPVEHALQKLPGLRAMRSVSREGLSTTELEFEAGHDRERALYGTAELLTQAAENLPPNAEPPKLLTVVPDSLPGIWVVVQSETLAPAQLATLAAQLRARLERLAGVNLVQIFGNEPEEWQVRLDRVRLAAHSISLAMCITALNQSEPNANSTAEDLEQLLVAAVKGVPVRLRDVAQVSRQSGPAETRAWINNKPAVALGVFASELSANETMLQVQHQVQESQRSLPQGVTLSTWPKKPSSASMLVELHAPPGAKFESMRKLAEIVEQAVAAEAQGGVLTLWNGDRAQVMKTLVQPHSDAAKTASAARQAQLPGARVRVSHLPGGAETKRPRFDVSLALVGPDRERLAQWSAQVSQQLAKAGYQDVVIEGADLQPRVETKLDRDRMAALGLDVNTARQWMKVGTTGLVLTPRGTDVRPIRVLVGVGSNELRLLTIPVGERQVLLTDIAQITVAAKIDPLLYHGKQPAVFVTAALPNSVDPSPAELAAARLKTVKLAEQAGGSLALTGDYQVTQP